jgi:hypothetical protein
MRVNVVFILLGDDEKNGKRLNQWVQPFAVQAEMAGMGAFSAALRPQVAGRS